MVQQLKLFATEDRVDLTQFATSIRSSSNFRFAWQFFTCYEPSLDSAETIRSALNEIAGNANLSAFLRDSIDDIYPRKFEIQPLHCHANIERDGAYFLDTMTRASLDRLGAYSVNLARSTDSERQPVHQLFSSIGHYLAFSTKPGTEPGCDVCQDRHNDLFTNWFFEVAWDYMFILTWPSDSLIWVGCLTDTD